MKFLWIVVTACLSSLTATSTCAQDADPEKLPTKPKTEPSRVTAAHILVQWKGLPDAQTERTKDEARARATEALRKARQVGVKFEDVVKEYSDDLRTKTRGGMIGILSMGKISPAFKAIETALSSMETGQVADVVETPQGFHVLTRLEIVEYSASHILISYKGGARAKATITRTKEAALKLAEQVFAETQVPGADFAKLAKTHSDGPSGAKGGTLGVFGPGQMVPAFEEALTKIQVGEVTGPVETQFGYHVIKRTKVIHPQSISASHILVGYKGSLPGTEVARTKDEALTLAKKIRSELKPDGSNFAALAGKHSDGPSKAQGGSLGSFTADNMVPPFSKAAFELKVGGISDVVETRFGFHIIYRTK